MDYGEAVANLYRAPHGKFVEERKRLAGVLKATGDKAGASKLGKLPRPPISAWTVNQLWWQAREHVEALFASAAKLRRDLSANAEHRTAMAELRRRAAQILQTNEHAATEATLRRITTTLAALAASGGFDPDPPGALSADRDPPGFEVVGITATEAVQQAAKPRPERVPDTAREAASITATAAVPPAAQLGREEAADAAHDVERTRRAQAEAAAERRRQEHAEATRRAALRALEEALGRAQSELARKHAEVERLDKACAAARAARETARATVDELAAKLAELQAD